MKVAGYKNDGAWFRTNKKIKALGPAGQTALRGQLEGDTDIGLMFTALEEIVNIAGYAELPVSLTSVEEWTGSMVERGIPRQVWMGVLSWDVYDQEGGDGDYFAVHAAAWRKGAASIRRIVKRFMLSRRQMLDFANEVGADEGNPGGVADADIET